MQAPDVLEIDPAESRLRRMRRSVLTSARLMRDQVRPGFRPGRWAMVTLTYRPDVEWDRRHVSNILHLVRRYLRTRGYALRYVWVLELTKAGKPHYHIAVELPKGITLPKPDKRGWWPHGSTRIEWARHVLGYLAKYVSKGSPEARFPRGARISGVGGLDDQAKREKRWWMAPAYVREQFGEGANPFRAPGGGWLCRFSGEWIASAWVLVAIGRRSIRLIRREDLPPGLQALQT